MSGESFWVTCTTCEVTQQTDVMSKAIDMVRVHALWHESGEGRVWHG